MATMSLSGDPVKKKKDVDACVDGECGPKKRGKMSISAFNPTKKRYSVGVYKEDPKPEQEGALHSNVRELGETPGTVRIQKANSKSSFTPAQEAEGRKQEIAARKEKKAISFNKKRM